jgi:hypothetical protein
MVLIFVQQEGAWCARHLWDYKGAIEQESHYSCAVTEHTFMSRRLPVWSASRLFDFSFFPFFSASIFATSCLACTKAALTLESVLGTFFTIAGFCIAVGRRFCCPPVPIDSRDFSDKVLTGKESCFALFKPPCLMVSPTFESDDRGLFADSKRLPVRPVVCSRSSTERSILLGPRPLALDGEPDILSSPVQPNMHS